MLLIHPPVAKPSEPPAGIARLAGALRSHSVPCQMLDGNLEGMLYLLEQPLSATDTWTRRAIKNRTAHLETFRSIGAYSAPGRYRRAVSDLNRLLAVAGENAGAVAGLADFQHNRLSPVRSSDLIVSAEFPEQNPFFGWFSLRLPELLEACSVSTIGFSLNYLSQALCTFAMIGYVRKAYPHIKIVVGGGLVTSWMRRRDWRNPFEGLIDRLIDGPGELPLLELSGVKWAGGRHVMPSYQELPLQDYLSPGLVLPYSAARGCWWNRCSFCPERTEGGDYLPVPVQQALADLRELTARTKPALVHLLDNAVSPALLRELADAPPQAPWYGFARIEEALADIDYCRALKRSGCVMLKLGLESGDQGVLDRLHKGIDVGTASRVLKALKGAGIAVYLYLLFGTPAETETEARRTLDFVVRHADTIGFLNLALFNMPAGGEEAEEFGTGAFYEGDLSLYTGFRHPRGWDRGLVRRFMTGEFGRHPAVAAIVRRDPPLFTSNHAPFFLMAR